MLCTRSSIRGRLCTDLDHKHPVTRNPFPDCWKPGQPCCSLNVSIPTYRWYFRLIFMLSWSCRWAGAEYDNVPACPRASPRADSLLAGIYFDGQVLYTTIVTAPALDTLYNWNEFSCSFVFESRLQLCLYFWMGLACHPAWWYSK
jgi:hypothetical protein